MGSVSATVFKAKCLELMDRVAERRETYVITKRGKPVAKLVPVPAAKDKGVFGFMRGRMTITGDLDKPLWSDREWREFERQRVEQVRVWDREWRRHGTISGKRPAPPPRRPAMRQRRRARGARPAAG